MTKNPTLKKKNYIFDKYPNNIFMSNKSVCDEKVFNHIFVTHAHDLRNYLYYKFGDLETAEDLVQESFVKLWHNCAKVALIKAKSFLYKIANNAFLDIKRHEKVVLQFKMSKINAANIESPEYILEKKEFLTKIQSTIASLPVKQREVFLLNRIDRKKYSEIAEMLHISVKAVEKRMHKALIIIRKEIGDV